MLDLFAELAARHGHYCPMSTLGLRLGQEAVRRVSDSGETGWRFRYLAKTCAADGIALAVAGFAPGVEFEVEQQGQHLLVCRLVTGKELSLALSAEALQLAKDYHGLDDTGKAEQLELLRNLPADRLIELAEAGADV